MPARRFGFLLLLLSVWVSKPVMAQVELGELQLTPPPNWSRTLQNGQHVFTAAGIPASAYYVVAVAEPRAAAVSSEVALQRAWDFVVQKIGREKARDADTALAGVGDVRWTVRTGVAVTATNVSVLTGMALSTSEHTAHLVYFYGTTQMPWSSQAPLLVAMLKSATSGASTAAPSAPMPNSATITAAGPSGPGNGFGDGDSGVYLGSGNRFAPRLATGMTIVRDARFVVLLPDGRWRNDLPPRGLDTDLNEDAQRLPDFWGKWSKAGGNIVAVRTNEKITVDADGWTKLPSIDGLVLNGRWIRADTRGTWGSSVEPELILRSDGTFEDRTGLLRMIGSLINFEGSSLQLTRAQEEALLAPGSGRYSCRNFTVTFRYSDGRVRKMSTYLPPNEDRKNPRALQMGGYLLISP